MTHSPHQKKLLLMGGSGFIGNALGEHFARQGWSIRLLTRKIQNYQTAYPCEAFVWNGVSIPSESLEGVDCVINLAGQGVADHRWSEDYRKAIRESRVLATRALASALQQIPQKPSVVVQASAVGYFGMQHRQELCDESTSSGADFLADVCKEWEAETQAIAKLTRLVIGRIGIVMGWGGGALEQIWDLYASGLGSTLGMGRQWMNWIHLQDVVGFFAKAVESERFTGVYNLVAPENIDNKNFHRVLASYTPSLSIMTAPALSLKAILGQRAELLLSAPQVVSKRLSESGYEFEFPDFAGALANLTSERTHSRVHYHKVKQWVPAPIAEVWAFVSEASNLERITPDWLGFRIRNMSTSQIGVDTTISYSLKLHGLPVTWRSRISKWNPETEFVDEQEKGPYSLWYHRHLFSELAGGTLMEDLVDYSLPLFPIGEIAFPLVKKDLHTIFGYRKHTLAQILGGVKTGGAEG